MLISVSYRPLLCARPILSTRGDMSGRLPARVKWPWSKFGAYRGSNLGRFVPIVVADKAEKLRRLGEEGGINEEPGNPRDLASCADLEGEREGIT